MGGAAGGRAGGATGTGAIAVVIGEMAGIPTVVGVSVVTVSAEGGCSSVVSIGGAVMVTIEVSVNASVCAAPKTKLSVVMVSLCGGISGKSGVPASTDACSAEAGETGVELASVVATGA